MAKEPENIPATHRTEAAKGLWYEAYGKPIVERNRMFVLFLLVLLAFISLSWTIILLIPRHVDVPWTVPVNPKTGEPISRPIEITRAYTPSQLQIQYFAAKWLRDLFTINPALTMKYITHDYLQTTHDGTQEIKQWEHVHQPIARMEAHPGFYATASILSTSFMGNGNLFIRVQQNLHHHSGNNTVRLWNCTLSYTLIPPTTVSQAYQDPIGFYVDEFVCTRSLQNPS